MKCPTCGAAELVLGTRDEPHSYKGQTTTIPAVTAQRCPACGESVTDPVETRRTMALMVEWNKQVNASHIDPLYITVVRKKLKLDQRQAAAIFGGGVNAFSRYETGRTKPALAVVKLLKVLDRHPELLDEIRAA